MWLLDMGCPPKSLFWETHTISLWIKLFSDNILLHKIFTQQNFAANFGTKKLNRKCHRNFPKQWLSGQICARIYLPMFLNLFNKFTEKAVYLNCIFTKMAFTEKAIYPNCFWPKWLFTQKSFTQIVLTEMAYTQKVFTQVT